MIRRMFVVMMVMALSFCYCQTVVFADYDDGDDFSEGVELVSGEGQLESGWVNHNCNVALRVQNVKQCHFETGEGDSPANNASDWNTGGASWHIFKVSDTPVKWSYYKKQTMNSSSPFPRPIYNKIKYKGGAGDTGYDPDEIQQECTEDKFDYYVAYVYDGWDRERANDVPGAKGRKFSVYFGPIAWREFKAVSDNGTHYPVYHYLPGRKTGGSHSAGDVVNGLKNGDDMSGWRIDGGLKDKDGNRYNNKENTAEYYSDEADNLYSRLDGNSNKSIPKGKGWFCLQPVYNKLTAIPVYEDDNGNWTYFDSSSGYVSQEVKARGGKNASISKSSFPSDMIYAFKRWEDPEGSSSCSGARDVCTKKLKGNKTVYAVFGSSKYYSTLDVKVANPGGPLYPNYVDAPDANNPIYVRPDAQLVFKIDYAGDAQIGYNAYVQVTHPHCNPGNIERISDEKATATHQVGAMYGSLCGQPWNNTLDVNGPGSPGHYYYTPGDTGLHTEILTKQLWQGDTGQTYATYAATSPYNPAYISFGVKVNGRTQANPSGQLSDRAFAAVPYNFQNHVKVNNKETEVVPAGGTKKISYNYVIFPKWNNRVGSTYATKVSDPKRKVEIYNQDNGIRYGEIIEEDDDYTNVDISSGLNTQHDTEISIPDVLAGTRLCVRVSIYPATSGEDYNTDKNANGYGGWSSEEKCFTVEKKPSIQFWGGNVYSRANIKTSTSAKNNIAGYSDYSYNIVPEGSKVRYFGSWGELGVASNGTVSGFGSGASMGYSLSSISGLSPNPFRNNSVSDVNSPGGSEITDYCDRVPLSIPNSSCISGTISGLSAVANITKAADDKQYILDLLIEGDVADDKMVFRTDISNDSSGTVNRDLVGDSIDTIRVISSDNSITIDGDLEYFTGTYTRYDQIPKLIIYSKKSINIACGVARIDALLIANDTVVTCGNIGDVTGKDNQGDNPLSLRIAGSINNRENSKQLFINGAIIAKRLIANRTYGAATGANSIVPAEIVDFDPTLYRFSFNTARDDDVTGKLDTSFIHEVAPRL